MQFTEPFNGLFRDRLGHMVEVKGYDRESQRVIYRRTDCGFECAAPLIVFRARFRRVRQ